MVLSFASCKKEEGCIDPKAYNFNSNAEIEDGSCLYNMEVQVWMNEFTAQALKDDGFGLLNFSFGSNNTVALDSLNWPIGDEPYGGGFALNWNIPEVLTVAAITQSVWGQPIGSLENEMVSLRVYEIEECARFEREITYP